MIFEVYDESGVCTPGDVIEQLDQPDDHPAQCRLSRLAADAIDLADRWDRGTIALGEARLRAEALAEGYREALR